MKEINGGSLKRLEDAEPAGNEAERIRVGKREFEQCDKSPETELLETCYKKSELLPTLGIYGSSDVSGDDYLSFRGLKLSNMYEIYELCGSKSPNQWRFCRTCHLFYWRFWDSTIFTRGNSANCDLFGMVSSRVGDLQLGGYKTSGMESPGHSGLISWTKWGKENPLENSEIRKNPGKFTPFFSTAIFSTSIFDLSP